MDITNFTDPMGLLGINNNPTGSLGLDMAPILEARAKQAEEEEAKRKRSERFSKLRNFADSLQAMNAGQSGNFGAQNQFLNNIDRRRAEEAARAKAKADKKKRDDFYNSLNPNQKMIFDMKEAGMPDSYIKSQFYPNPVKRESFVAKDGYRYFADGKQERVFPGVTVKEEQTQADIYKENAARIKNIVMKEGIDSPNLTTQERDFYNNDINKQGFMSLDESLGQILLGNTGGQNNSTKNYTVINSAYGSMTANQIIDQAFEMNKEVEPKTTREGVIKNLIENKIISE
tara:strand:+ start:2433 stop:3293 length:861 start_codon:yes stop_codon:yes gene_type:complete